MADIIPEDLFTTEIMSNELKKKIKSIITFKQTLKEKYPVQFLKDIDDNYIYLEFAIPSFNLVLQKEELKFDYKISNNLDKYVKKEFEKFIASIIK